MAMYFTTSTVINWIHLFRRKDFLQIIIEALQFLITTKRIELHAYVAMPNHLHLIFSPLAPQQLRTIFRDFHKFTAQQILKILRNEKSSLLAQLRSNKTDRKYSVWQSGHMAKEIESASFFEQKLEYIHNNPLQEHWQLSATPEDYLYSSAKDYLLGETGILPIVKINI